MKFSILPISILFILTLHTNVARSSDDWKKESSWRPFGPRWALAYDEKGKTTAIYDLAFPEWSKPLSLGIFDQHLLQKQVLVDDITEVRETQELQEIDKGNVAETLQQVEQINFDSLTESNLFGKGGLPATFNFNDLKIKDVLKTNRKLREVVSLAQDILTDAEGPEVGQDFMNSFQFQRGVGGTLTMTWEKPERSEKKDSGPRKICDLRSLKWAFLQTMKINSLKITLAELAGISGPTLAGAFVATALDRFFHFYELMLKTQQNMLLEALAATEDKNSLYAHYQITPEDKKFATEALIFSQASLETSWKWTTPEKEWAKLNQKQKDNEDQNLNWLKEHHIKLDLINSQFGWTINSQGKMKLVALASHKPNRKKGPRVAVDYENLNHIRHERLRKEMATSAVVFGTAFIPYGGFVVRYFYKKWIEGSSDTDKVWEGRLTVILEELAARLAADFSLEFKTLEGQRINPLMISNNDSHALALRRGRLLGLDSRP